MQYSQFPEWSVVRFVYANYVRLYYSNCLEQLLH